MVRCRKVFTMTSTNQELSGRIDGLEARLTLIERRLGISRTPQQVSLQTPEPMSIPPVANPSAVTVGNSLVADLRARRQATQPPPLPRQVAPISPPLVSPLMPTSSQEIVTPPAPAITSFAPLPYAS